MSDQEFQKFLDEVEEMLKKQGEKLSELAQAAPAEQLGPAGEATARGRARGAPAGHRTHDRGELLRPRAGARARPRQARSRRSSELREQTREDRHSAPSSRPRWRSISTAGSRRSRTSSGATCGWSARSATCSAREEQRLNQLADKSFYYLSDEELDRMKEAVTRLAQRLKNVHRGAPQARQEGPLRYQAHAAPRTWSTAACRSSCASRSASAKSRRW